jgi:hypothetical protein
MALKVMALSNRPCWPFLLDWLIFNEVFIESFFKGNSSGRMLAYMKGGELNQYILKSHFRWSLSTYILWLRVCGNMPVGSSIICKYTYILTNNTQELTPYIYEFKWDKNRVRQYFMSMPIFQPQTLRRLMDALANSDMPPFWYSLNLWLTEI